MIIIIRDQRLKHHSAIFIRLRLIYGIQRASMPMSLCVSLPLLTLGQSFDPIEFGGSYVIRSIVLVQRRIQLTPGNSFETQLPMCGHPPKTTLADFDRTQKLTLLANFNRQ
jgi:hypothetical protein